MQSVFEKPLLVKADSCTGCRICEIICAQAKNCSIADSKIKVLSMEKLGVNIPVIRVDCDLCNGETKCVELCPTECIQFIDVKEAALLRKKNKVGTFPAPIIGAGRVP